MYDQLLYGQIDLNVLSSVLCTCMARLEIEGRKYCLKYDPRDTFVASNLTVAYCQQLAKDFMPAIFDPWGHGSKPSKPEFIAYRLIIDSKMRRLCILYEVYWRRQDCTWKELNKDHDHDYEQIQIHFDMKTGEVERVVVSSVGPISYAGHGVEVYSHIRKAVAREVQYTTSSRRVFPWGGENGQNNVTQIREMPIDRLVFRDGRPVMLVLNCYHAFAGKKKWSSVEVGEKLTPRLEKLDGSLLERWYYGNVRNRFGHDISDPFEEACLMYYPPPEDWKSRIVYSFVWLFSSLRRVFE
jgi:hypothetical protein